MLFGNTTCKGTSLGQSLLPPTPPGGVASHRALCTSLDGRLHVDVGHLVPCGAVHATPNPQQLKSKAIPPTTSRVFKVSLDPLEDRIVGLNLFGTRCASQHGFPANLGRTFKTPRMSAWVRASSPRDKLKQFLLLQTLLFTVDS